MSADYSVRTWLLTVAAYPPRQLKNYHWLTACVCVCSFVVVFTYITWDRLVFDHVRLITAEESYCSLANGVIIISA